MKFEDWKKLEENRNKTLNEYYSYLRSSNKLNFEKFNESNFESTSKSANESSPNRSDIKKDYWQYLIYSIIAVTLFITNCTSSKKLDIIVWSNLQKNC